MLLLCVTVHRSGKDRVGSLFTGSVIVILVVVVVSVMLKLTSLSRQFCFSDYHGSFASFLVLLVCFSGFWFLGLFSDLLRFAGIKAFISASATLENLARPTTLDMARNGLVLIAAVARCRLLSLFS
jgi:RsiW-degrading membrane proteinase PrsW (M82 family)